MYGIGLWALYLLPQVNDRVRQCLPCNIHIKAAINNFLRALVTFLPENVVYIPIKV